jgi:hypothetical protein
MLHRLFWLKIQSNFDGKYKDKKGVRIYYEFEVKRNFTYLFTINEACLVRAVNHCIQEWFDIWVDSTFLHEGRDVNRIIDEEKLRLVNCHINTWFREEWCPKGVKVQNIKITYLIR